jgi:ribonuclease HII
MIAVGIDEVGRGCWAGPVVAGAVILRAPIKGLRDSKKLTKKQREKLALEIHLEAVAVGLGWVDAETIDKVGITTAVKTAMYQALGQIHEAYNEIIIDGHINFFPEDPRAKAVIKADDSVPAVSAASIVAKVARDQFMTEAASKHPDYGFDKHVGYGTALHLERLKLHGVSALHRRSYKPVAALLAA